MRITKKDLDCVVNRINSITSSPATSYTKDNNGNFNANIGNYHLSGAYGGYALHRMFNEGGGIEDVFQIGYAPKKELFGLMQAFINGLGAK